MPSFGCIGCPLEFRSISKLRRHCRTAIHPLGCKSCKKLLTGPMAFEQHMLASSAHRITNADSESESEPESSDEEEEPIDSDSVADEPAEHVHPEVGADDEKTFDCLFCDREFRFASAIAMHIESGSHGITRHQVTVAVHKLGVVPTISVDRRLAAPIEPPAAIVTYSATEEAFNGRAYQCFFCPCTYAALRGLNAHLNSPAHDADEFKCPKCRIQFKLVSGLMQHIESGTCAIAQLEDVRSQFENLTDQFSRALKI